MILGSFNGLERERWGGLVERRRREFSSLNLEREREVEMRDFGAKITYILPCAQILKCPSS
jgi:hypothetical protein